MSASPAHPSPSGVSDGRTPTSINGQPRMRQKPKPDPLRQNRKPPPKPAAARPKPIGPGSRATGGALTALNKGSTFKPLNGFAIPKNQGPGPAIAEGFIAPQTTFSEVPQGAYKEYPLVTTKRALREGIRHHIARFQAKKAVDPTNQEEFVRPVTLQRRDPRQPPPGKADLLKEENAEEIVDEKEKERQEIARAEKEAQRAADLAQIAPSGNNAAALAAKKNQAFRNEKTTQVYRLDKTEEDIKQSDLRYEEALPWHLEDVDSKQTWVGSYEAALSETNVVLVVENGSFKMIPIEKWYKFTSKNQFKALTIEEAEEQLKKKSKPSRWAMHDDEKKEQVRANAETRRLIGGVYGVKKESSSFRNAGKRETEDADDLDFEGDLFADDDEMPTVEPDNDEDTKTAQDKIKREQLGANLFGEADENEIEKELEKEEREEEMRKKLGKTTKKALKKREKNYLYESDSSTRDPFSSESDSDTTDDEKQQEEDRRKDEEAKLKAKNNSKLPSGASSKGNTTPSGRPKHSDPLRKSNHLKRPGSPNLSASETSGNESSRKKHKKKHHSAHPTPGGSRPMSPAPSSQPTPGSPSRKSSIVKLNLNPSKLSEIQGASPNSVMSDGEATEMSESGMRKKKFKLKIGGVNSPGGSRAGSPGGSRAGSPGVNAASLGESGNSVTMGPITAAEILAVLPQEGIAISDLLKNSFSKRVTDKEARSKFIATVREVADFGPDKLLRPKKSV